MVPTYKKARPTADRRMPKKSANSGLTSFAGIGLSAVLAMSASSLLSIHWLRAAAPPADNAVPIVSERKRDKSAANGS